MHVRMCPNCHSLDVHRSRRRGFVERFLLALVFKRPFRCDSCKTRYYGYVHSKPIPPEYVASKSKPNAGKPDGQAGTQEGTEESAVPAPR